MLTRSDGHKTVKQNYINGFALPTVLISSFIMLTVLLVSVASTAAVKVALVNQYYDQLSKNASDAGVAHAISCLEKNDGVAQWGDGTPYQTGGPLMPGTDCTGKMITGLNCDTVANEPRCLVLSNGVNTDILLVGGGGGSNFNNMENGAGGGGQVLSTHATFGEGQLSVTVGNGGGQGSDGGTSSLGTYSVTGGLKSYIASSMNYGGSSGSYIGGSTGCSYSPGNQMAGGGGAGAGGDGSGCSQYVGGNGGPGVSSSISGLSVAYGGGGGGSGWNTGGIGADGGGSAGNTPGYIQTACAPSRGGGAAGVFGAFSAATNQGCSGRVIISYPHGSMDIKTGCDSKSVISSTKTVCDVTTVGTTNLDVDILEPQNITSTYVVGAPTIGLDGRPQSINSSGKVNLLRSSDGNAWRTFNHESKSNVVLSGALGNTAEGNVTISADIFIDSDLKSNGRICADGGDAVSYAVQTNGLSSNSATLASIPSTGCLKAGDEVLLISLKGTSTNYINVGNYETLKVQSVATKTVTFTTNKNKYYGNGFSDDTGIGTTSGTHQRVMLQRLPNYATLTINSGATLTVNPWDNNSGVGGVLAFRAKNVVINGSISATGKGYAKGIGAKVTPLTGSTGGETYNGYGGSGGSYNSNGLTGQGGGGGGGTNTTGPAYGTSAAGQTGSGGGGGGGNGITGATAKGGHGGSGGYATVGQGGYVAPSRTGDSGSGTSGGAGKSAIASTTNAGGGGGGGSDGAADSSVLLNKLRFGSGGGGGGNYRASSVAGDGCNGFSGGGIILIYSNSLTMSGSIANRGSQSPGSPTCPNPTAGYGGAGAGGSVLIHAYDKFYSTGTLYAYSGNSYWGATAGNGRVAIYSNSITSGTINPASSPDTITGGAVGSRMADVSRNFLSY